MSQRLLHLPRHLFLDVAVNGDTTIAQVAMSDYPPQSLEAFALVVQQERLWDMETSTVLSTSEFVEAIPSLVFIVSTTAELIENHLVVTIHDNEFILQEFDPLFAHYSWIVIARFQGFISQDLPSLTGRLK